jgi:hypothetical protein
MRLRIMSVVLGLVALLFSVTPASAGRVWCSRDPVIKVNGQVVDVLVSSYTEMNASANGPVMLVITVPVGSTASVLATDNGFGYGYSVTVKTSSTLTKTAKSTQVRVEVYAPAADATLPVKIDVKPRSVGLVKAATTQGLANSWVTAQTP